MDSITVLDINATSSKDLALLDGVIDRLNAKLNAKELDPLNFKLQQSLHDGVYTRTILVAKGSILVGALIKIPTTLLVSGECYINFKSDDSDDLKLQYFKGFNTFKCSAMRRQVFYAVSDLSITMVFKTNVKTFADAEKEFTNEYNLLMR